MRVCETVADIRRVVAELRQSGSVALVPTMGYFHAGHLALMREAGRRFPAVVVSIFVNPLQFGPAEDFAAYPRDLERDLRLARETGVTAVFVPPETEMYPERPDTFVDVERLNRVLCGRTRPGHFRGVATVVTKLFNIIRPDAAFFGQKDAQQLQVIRRLVQDLNFDLEIVAVPTVREADGLAMSSRNVHLSLDARRAATVLYQSLQAARAAIRAGEPDLAVVRERLAAGVTAEPLAELEYAEILVLPDLSEPKGTGEELLLAVAARFGRVRLIDNIIVRCGDQGGKKSVSENAQVQNSPGHRNRCQLELRGQHRD